MTLQEKIKKGIRNSFLYPIILRYLYFKHFDKVSVKQKLYKLGCDNLSREIVKMRMASVMHLWLPEEYLSYRYDTLSRKGRKSYVLNWEKELFSRKVNPKSCWKLLNDKYATYMHFKEFYKRNVLSLYFSSEEIELEMLDTFFYNQDKAIVKPISGGSGHGVVMIEKSTFLNVKDLYCFLKTKYKNCVVEEVIKQDERMARFHPSSVNTLRMPAIRVGKEIVFLHPGMRIGRGSSIVDNGGAGGILAAIDDATGIICAAATEDGTDYVVHPDSGVPIIGYTIPMWQEAKDFTCQLMDALPEGIYISWDIALSDKGWLMIEGNVQGQFFGRQLPIHRGIKDELNEICKKMGIKTL